MTRSGGVFIPKKLKKKNVEVLVAPYKEKDSVDTNTGEGPSKKATS